MAFTLHQLLKNGGNPSGSTGTFANFRARQALDSVFIRLLRQYRGQFYASVWVDYMGLTGTKGNLIYEISVPSEYFHINRITWQVVFLIKYDEHKSYADREIQVFSTSPDWLYTQSYIYYKNAMIPDFLVSKLPMEAKTNPPVKRNPAQVLGLRKVEYTAARYLQLGCLTDQYISRYGRRFTPIEQATLYGRLPSTDQLVRIYQNAKHMQALKNKTAKIQSNAQQQREMRQEQHNYEQFRRATMPNYVGIFFKHPSRAKLTAHNAVKMIDRKSSNSSVIKPKIYGPSTKF